MSTESGAAVDAVRAFFARQGAALDWEILCKRSVGGSVARRRAELRQSERWTEEALAVRVRCADGRSSLASAAGWGNAEGVARAALEEARRQVLPCAPGADFAESWGALVEAPAGAETVPGSPELARLLELVFEGATKADDRTGRLELGRARAARVSARLVNSRGLDLGSVQDLAHLEAEVVTREISKHAGCFDAVAAARIGEAEALALGDRLGRALRRQLDGMPRAPSGGRVLLSAEVVGEISFRLAPALLGLEGSPLAKEGLRVGAGLRLREDSALDAEARSAAADGVGRRLATLDLVLDGRLIAPETSRLPLVRPGIADAPRPGWLRLSWASEGGLSDEELVAELGSGLLVERAVTESVDAALLGWRGLIEGCWVEDGVPRRAVARLPLSLDLPSLLPSIRAAGSSPRPAHGSGTIRAVPWLLDALPPSPDRPASAR